MSISLLPTVITDGWLNVRRHTRDTRHAVWNAPSVIALRTLGKRWRGDSHVGLVALVLGMIAATLLILAIGRLFVAVSNPGLIYLPLVGMLAYHWSWRYAVAAMALSLACVYYFFITPFFAFKSLTPSAIEQLTTFALVGVLVLALVYLARDRRRAAEHEASRFSALNVVSRALSNELNEERLLQLIAETARDLTGAEFAAFTLRPINAIGQPLVPSEGNLFHLAAVVGVTAAQEQLFRHMPLGGEGILAPIFRYGVPVRIADALAVERSTRAPLHETSIADAPPAESRHEIARRAAKEYAHGQASIAHLQTLGVPRGHPVVRSFLGAPLLDRTGEVRGGLLLGHSAPDRFSDKDEEVLMAQAAQAAIALDNARLFQAAQAQARELDTIFESIEDGVALMDEVGIVLRENAAAQRIRERQATIGGPQDIQCRLREMATLALQGSRSETMTVSIPDESGETRDYHVSASPMRSSQAETAQALRSPAIFVQHTTGSGVVIVWHDVTEARNLLAERQAHAEAEERRALLQLVIDELPGGVYLVQGVDARLVLANRAAADVWGAEWSINQSMAEFLLHSGVRIFGVEGHVLAPEQLATLRAARTGEAVHHQQEVIRQPDGTALPVLLNAVGLNLQMLGWSAEGDAQTPISGALVVLQDVTALKETERLKDEFIGIAAHELRTPLAVLKGFAQMLITQTRRGKGPKLAEWQEEAIEALDQATMRLVQLSDDLLDVTRLQAGRLLLRIEPCDLAALARRVATRMQLTTEKHTICVYATPEHVVANLDAQRIEQVINNLLGNAVKYSPDGGEIAVAVGEEKASGVATVSVHDHGIGMPTAQQALIFGRFARADNARMRGIEGTGLGLYLCRELVERHGGRIWFESTEGQGSTFSLTLPLTLGLGESEEESRAP